MKVTMQTTKAKCQAAEAQAKRNRARVTPRQVSRAACAIDWAMLPPITRSMIVPQAEVSSNDRMPPKIPGARSPTLMERTIHPVAIRNIDGIQPITTWLIRAAITGHWDSGAGCKRNRVIEIAFLSMGLIVSVGFLWLISPIGRLWSIREPLSKVNPQQFLLLPPSAKNAKASYITPNDRGAKNSFS